MFRIILCFTFLVSHHALANDNKTGCAAELKAYLLTFVENTETHIPPNELKTILVDMAACLDEVAATPTPLPHVEAAAAITPPHLEQGAE